MALTPFHSGEPLDILPTADELPHPSQLFSGPPYILTLSVSRDRVTIQGTHLKSLSLIKTYFEMYAPTNPNDTRKPPYLRYALKPSYVLAPKSPQNCDTLIIERYDEHWHWFDVNPAPFMSFIEGVMGYEQGRHDGYMISYTRRKPFNDTVRWGIPPAYTSTEGT